MNFRTGFCDGREGSFRDAVGQTYMGHFQT